MKLRVWICAFLLQLSPLTHAQKFFPYPVEKKTLRNGMDVIVIETPEFKNVLSYNTLVLAGARNEIEKGKTGLAHLFEHILFRHRWQGEENGYDQMINRMGAFNNAWTNFDVTYYHPLTFTANLSPQGDLPSLPQLEAGRFKNLDFTEEIFKTEAGAVLGEYRRNASDPGLRMEEVMLALAFPSHPYGHTTLGYLEDVEDMPNEHQAALDFYRTYYRPNNVVLIVAGDVKAAEIFQLAEQLYGDWQSVTQPDIPDPEPLAGSKKDHVSWDADVPPRISYTYRVPAFNPSSKEGAIGQLLPDLLTDETAPLFQKLRYAKKTVSNLFLSSNGYESIDSRLLELVAILFKDQYEQKKDPYFTDVIADMETAFRELQQFSKNPDADRLLAELKSKFRYDFLSVLNSPANLSEQFAWYYRFERDPNVFDTLIRTVDALAPADIDAFAKKYFIDQNRVIVTMSYEEQANKRTKD